MTQLGLYIYIYIYIWKCNKEIPCVAILNKQKCHFFIYKIREPESGIGPACGRVGTIGGGGSWKRA
jgi:hypothetical protein